MSQREPGESSQSPDTTDTASPIVSPPPKEIPLTSNEYSRVRLHALDGMRGVAAVCISIFHTQDLFSNSKFFSGGWISVDLFFLISGIVMTHVYEQRIRDGLTTFPVFLSHRLARIWPIHILSMFLMLGLDLYLHLPKWGWNYGVEPDHIYDWGAPIYTFVLNIFLLQNIGLYDGHTWDGNGWSLTPEIVVNIIWFYLLFSKRLSSKTLVAIAIVSAILQYNLGDTVQGTILGSNLCRFTISYSLGCLLYRHFIANPRLTKLSTLWNNVIGLLLAAFIIFVMIDLAYGKFTILNKWEWLFVLFIFPGITYFILQKDTVLNWIFSSAPFVFLGTISYSYYLLHIEVAVVIHKFIQANAPLIPDLGVLFLTLSIIVSTLSYYFIESPLRRLLRERIGVLISKIAFDIY